MRWPWRFVGFSLAIASSKLVSTRQTVATGLTSATVARQGITSEVALQDGP